MSYCFVVVMSVVITLTNFVYLPLLKPSNASTAPSAYLISSSLNAKVG